MQELTIFIVFLVITTICCLFGKCFQAPSISETFSVSVSDDRINEGNPVSWAGISNNVPLQRNWRTSNPVNRKLTFNNVQTPDLITVQGHGVPLATNQFFSQKGSDNIPTLSGMNIKCSANCCPSQYTCDSGCLCLKTNS